MKRKSSQKKQHKTKQSPKVLYLGWRIIYFFAFVLVAGGLLLFLPKTPAQNEACANSLSCITDLSGNYDEDNAGEFEGKQVTGPALAGKPNLAQAPALTNSNVLGDTTADSKRIYVDLSSQKLMAYENNNLVFEFPVSTGKSWWPTPTGDFRIWIKLRYTRMQGGSGAGYYNLPNVPYTMYFYNDKVPKHRGYGIHGAYWHNNFGHPMSHGCINMKEEDVAKIYEWAMPSHIVDGKAKNVVYANAEQPGTLITIYGSTPQN